MQSAANSDRLPFQRILVATDFSASSLSAVQRATTFARLYGATLYITHILPSDATQNDHASAWRDGQRLETELLVQGALRGIQHELLVGSGEIWAGISQLVSERNVDAIVVGTRGRTGLARVLLGSVAERIFRQALCPVLTVGPRAAGEVSSPSLRRILYATDFTPSSLHAFRYAFSLTQHAGAHLMLLNVIPELPATETASRESILEAARSRLRAIMTNDLILPREPEFFVGFGTPATRILALASDQSADLIVLGLRQPGDSLAGRRWTTASEVTGKAICPVLTVRAPA
jgi:nucleotide-binding universal stress UspA family protein